MDARALLDLLPDEEDVGSVGEPASGQERGLGPGLDVPVCGDASELLALLVDSEAEQRQNGNGRRRPWNHYPRFQLYAAKQRQQIRDRSKQTQKQLQVQMFRHNQSGRAKTRDELMSREKKAKVKGSSGWRKWLPEAIQRTEFAKGSVRAIQQSMKDGPWQGKVGLESIVSSRVICARAIVGGQKRGIKRLRARSEEEPFGFWITSNMFDESKLWYKVRGKGYRRFSTLVVHGQCTWEDAAGVHDEDVIHPPRAMRRYSAKGQWNILSDDPSLGICPSEAARPLAGFYGTVTASDSHGVNKLTLKHARQAMPETDLMLVNFCTQHQAGNTTTKLSTYLNLFTRVWTLAKTFSEGDFHQDLEEIIMELLEDMDEGLEVVDPANLELDAGDLGHDYTRAVVDRCFTHALELGEDTVSDEARQKFQELKAAFLEFFPVGWNRARPLHPCAAGCCGPSPCHSRRKSVERGSVLVAQVIMKRIVSPAQNKWTKMDPAFGQATLQACFFRLVPAALEHEVGAAFEDLTAVDLAALGQEHGLGPGGDDQAQANQEYYKGQAKRYGKRCLAFLGDPETSMLLLVWLVVGAIPLHIHYRLFKHATWFSHARPD